MVFKGDEVSVLNHYKNLYNSGVEPNNFLNEFLEILYFVKNISYIENVGNNFSLNDSDYKKITSLSKEIDSSALLLFWEFTLKTLKEINIVANPNLLVEMFLIQLTYLKKKNVMGNNDQNKLMAAVISLSIFGIFTYILLQTFDSTVVISEGTSTKLLGEILLSRFVFPFELVSFVLLGALIGGITLARKDNALMDEDQI